VQPGSWPHFLGGLKFYVFIFIIQIKHDAYLVNGAFPKPVAHFMPSVFAQKSTGFPSLSSLVEL
jgi:hypothetical protein